MTDITTINQEAALNAMDLEAEAQNTEPQLDLDAEVANTVLVGAHTVTLHKVAVKQFNTKCYNFMFKDKETGRFIFVAIWEDSYKKFIDLCKSVLKLQSANDLYTTEMNIYFEVESTVAKNGNTYDNYYINWLQTAELQ